MKQETAKKTPKWLLPVIIAAAVLVIAGVVLAIVLGGGQQQQQQGPSNAFAGAYELYWNVDRQENLDPDTNMSNRQPDAEGKYKIRFAVGGQQVDLYCADKKLVNAMDMMDLMALAFDDAGLIIDAAAPNAIATEVFNGGYVKSFDGTTLIVNSTMTMNGMEQSIAITDATGLYNVDSKSAKMIGESYTDLSVMDKVSIYANAEGVVTHIFMTKKAVSADIYYRIAKMMVDGETTRVPDENGVYTIEMAHKGQLVDVKCRDKNVVNLIDSGWYTSAIQGLIFDEEGYVIDLISAEEAIQGKLLAKDYTITAIDGDNVTLTSIWSQNQDIGNEITIKVTPDCEIYLIETGCEADFIGQATSSFKVGDRMYLYSDFNNNPVMAFITCRRIDSPMYYNTNRMYDEEKKETTRQPDENGYYVFDLLLDGKVKQYKTKDKKLATKIDSSGTGHVGLELKGNIITAVGQNSCVCGNSSYANRWVSDLMGTIGQFVLNGDDFATETSVNVLHPNFVAYDCSDTYGINYGEVTKIRKGDKITGYLNESNELIYAFVYQRYEEDTKLYWNVNRMYDFDKLETTRQPDAEGYYVFDLVCEGKPLQAKTKDRDLATYIDKQSTHYPALKISKGIIKGAYDQLAAIPFGRIQMNGVSFNYMTPQRGIAYYFTRNGVRVDRTPEEAGFKVAKDALVINQTLVHDNFRGEISKLQQGDAIKPFINDSTKEIVHICIVSREYDSDLYWNTNRMYDSSTGTTTRTPDKDGYYVYELAVKGEIKTFKTKDKALADDLDSYGAAMALKHKDGIALKAYSINTGVVKNYKRATAGDGYDVVSVKGNKLTLQLNNTRYAGNDNYGEIVEVTLAKNYECYNVSASAKQFGEKAKLEAGDRVALYNNPQGEVNAVFITTEMTRKEGAVSYCEHCDKEVWWEPLNHTIYENNAHYYLPTDLYRSKFVIGYTPNQLTEKEGLEQYEIVLDLNGYQLSASSQNFEVYSQLTIMDTVGGGEILSGGYTDRYGAAIRSRDTGVINILSGTIRAKEDETPLGRGGCLYAEGTINMYGGTVIGGYALQGGSVYLSGDGVLNLYGGEITGGKGETGGNIYGYGGAAVNLYGGKVTNGYATLRGGNIDLRAYNEKNPVLLIDKNATVSGGVAVSTGGNIYTVGGSVAINGIVENGTAMAADGTLADGGNIYATTAATVTVDGTVRGGKAAVGGNIFLQQSELTLKGAVEGGKAQSGANIYAIANAENLNKITVDGGKVAGDMHITGFTNIALTGKVEIPMGENVALNLLKETVMDITGLTADSSIVITAPAGVFTTVREDIADLANVFTPAEEGASIEPVEGAFVYEARELTPAERVAEINAWVDANKAAFEAGENLPNTCPVCGAKGVAWEGINGASHQNDSSWGIFESAGIHHFYLTEDITLNEVNLLAETGSTGAVCLYLNKNIETTGGIVNRGILNIFGDGSITRKANANNSDALIKNQYKTSETSIYGGTYNNEHATALILPFNSSPTNIYAGTFNSQTGVYRNPDCSEAVLNLFGGTLNGGSQESVIFNTRGTVNMYDGAAINAGEVTASQVGGAAVKMDGANTFNMYGGKIVGGGTKYYGGNVYITRGTFNMYGGEIAGGHIVSGGWAGGNVYSKDTFNMYGGKIYGGTSDLRGGNISIDAGSMLMEGGEIYGGTATNNKFGGNIYLNGTLTMTGGKIYNGTAGDAGDNIYTAKNSVINMSGDAMIYGGAEDNVYLNGTVMTMSDNAKIVSSNNGSGCGVMVSRSGGIGSKLILSGNASVITDRENPNSAVRVYATDANNAPTDYLFITNDWAGTAYLYLNEEITYGATLADHIAQCGTYADGVFTAGGTFTGNLYLSSKTLTETPAAVTAADGVLTVAQEIAE